MSQLATISRVVKARAQRRLLAHGVHAGQQFLLERLWQEDGLAPGELAALIGVETSTISREAQRMERAGLVERRRDPHDARLVRIYLTSSGRQLQQVVPGIMDSLTEEALRYLEPGERQQLYRLLDQVRRNLLDES